MKLYKNYLIHTLCTLVFATLILTQVVRAQVPQLLSYQGVIEVNSVLFSGEGAFKFALVNAAGSSSFWSNDGSSVAGSEPMTAVSLSVDDGYYSVLLGDTTLTNMTVLSATVFKNTEVYLRIWFNDGSNGFQQLAPDQQVAAVGYAMMAGQVANASITADKLAPGVAAESLSDSNVAVISAGPNVELESAGYIKMGQFPTDAEWDSRDENDTTPAGRYVHSAVWTGNQLIIWGGFTGNSRFGTGARYDLTTGTWVELSEVGAPETRSSHSWVWTGSEMIIWGGVADGNVALNSGGRYDPVSDTWTSMSLEGAPSARSGHTMVWTGTQVIVWGGGVSNTGYSYDPNSDTWTPISVVNAPSARSTHATVWTGSKMVVWGGANYGSPGTGGIYDPSTDTWVATSTDNAPDGRRYHVYGWTGSEMIVWGGITSAASDTGGRFNPETNTWKSMSTGPLSARYYAMGTWTGNEFVIYGGYDGSDIIDGKGALYDPSKDTWTPMLDEPNGNGQARTTAVWTGREVLYWGNSGKSGTGWSRRVGVYRPGVPMFVYGKP